LDTGSETGFLGAGSAGALGSAFAVEDPFPADGALEWATTVGLLTWARGAGDGWLAQNGWQPRMGML